MAELSWTDNAKLGAAGALDLYVSAMTLGLADTHFAADEYASQVAAGKESYSNTLEEMQTSGASAEQLYSVAYEAGAKATDEGALLEAAGETAAQTVNIGGKILTVVIVAGVVVAVLYGGFLALSYAKAMKG